MQNDHALKSAAEFLERQSVGAASFIRPERVSVDLLTPNKPNPEAIEPDSDDSVCVIKIPVPGTRKARRKKGSGKLRELKPKSKKPTTEERSQEKKPWMKYRASESPNGKSKSNVTQESGKSAEKVRSHHFPTPVQTKQTDDDAEPCLLPQKKSLPDEPLDLAPASRRRANWTPPPAQQLGPEGSRSSDIEELLSSAAKNCNAAAARVSFESLLENYVRKEDASDGKRSETPEGIPDALKKRKLAQSVPTSDSATVSRDPSPVKKASKRKKPRTITELATAAYAAPEEPEAAPSASLLAYVEQQASGVTAAAKGKPKKKTAKSKRLQKAPEPASILLSPGTAIKQVANQDFVFGTSSQLAREHSPTFLRDIQTAVRASNSTLDEPDPFTTPLNSDSIEPPPRKKLWEVGARDDDGRLVDLEIINLVGTPAASVPEHGDSFGYLHVETAIQTRIRDPAEVDEEVVLPKLSPASAVSANINSADASREMVPCIISSDTGNLGMAKISDVQQQTCTPPNSMHPSKALELLDIPAPEPVGAPVALVVEHAPAGPTRPRYELYTDVQLTKEVKKFGFKPIKRRTAMIALLGQCWESQNLPRVPLSPLPSNQPLSTISGLTSSAVASMATAPETSKRPRGRPRKDSITEVIPDEPPPSAQPPAPSPKRPRGRPRKDAGSPAAASTTKSKPKVKPKASLQATKKAAKAEDVMVAATSTSRLKVSRPRAAAAEVIEIPDSASDGSLLTSSPEMRFSSPPAVDVCLSLDEDAEMSLAPSVTSTQSNLMDHITKAVKAAPPTQDPNEPSWHEKMLMYDPVILEDLAAWLNSGQLSEAGHDGEVSAFEVKQWCESKSVCCLWRVNLSGKERKRY
ncbi:Structure-specific endonuclease subunit SLX4 like protein [Verticillium longisporum]|uniref:Structure-specific endonuclease subunit SLX4 n=1 Tax=Verticillium longisporum TaxID=100787 RepID=A0A8I3ARI9_VERLO|nr:Structure-specific endonuclease subunit SLX4 like protein [Verticillium longisporum]KAG7133976.1 Structure-specific endonuclease subunit SLX4 like protein [Verticillium longisporum]